MHTAVSHFIRQHALLSEASTCLVALSGGADSVALLRVLLQLGYPVEAAHCNFHLRGEESQRDEQFCADLCRSLGVALHLAHFDTRTYASLHRESIELAARNLRYRWFEQLRQDLHAQAVCVAHHKDDSVETILMNLLRGTGIAGLTGIAPRRDHIVRPLLCVSRDDILAYLQHIGQDYVTDSTNLQAEAATRNRLRLQVIPLLKQLNPRAADNILRTAEHLRDVERLIPTDQGVDSYHLHRWLSPLGFSPAQVEDMARHAGTPDATGGRLWQSATHEVVLHRGRLLMQERHDPLPTLRLPEEGRYRYGQQVLTLSTETVGAEVFCPSRDAWHATLDADSLQWPLTLRPSDRGDRMQPLGMKGTRPVSDILTDRHKSLFEKRDQPVLADATGRLVWLPGIMPCHHCRVTPGTRRVLHARLTVDSQE